MEEVSSNIICISIIKNVKEEFYKRLLLPNHKIEKVNGKIKKQKINFIRFQIFFSGYMINVYVCM